MTRWIPALAGCLLVLVATPALAQHEAPAPETGGPAAPQPQAAEQAQAPRQAQAPQAAQPATPAPRAPRAQEAPAADRPSRKPINVRIDVTVTEHEGTKPSRTRNLSVTAADQNSAQIRVLPEVATPGPVREAEFSVDARPEILDTTKLRLFMGIEYNVVDPTAEKGARSTLRSRQELVLESGKPMVGYESTDPVTERRVTVTVTATILR